MTASGDKKNRWAGPVSDMEFAPRRGRRSKPLPQTRSDFEFASAARHSQRVRYLKFGLPLLALFTTGFFSAATFFAGSDTSAPAAAPAKMTDGRIIMANPKLEGFTGDKQPYSVIADRAIQQSAASPVVELENITANLPFGKSATAKVTAGSGHFDNSAGKLDMADSILLTTSDGMTAVLSSAKVNVTTSEMSTEEPVDIKTDGSHITADKMQVTQGGKVIIFENRVRLNIDQKKLKQAGIGQSEAASQ